jgi:hypothetical protein
MTSLEWLRVRAQSDELGSRWVREARLREEFAAEYPGLIPGVWMPVADLAISLVQRVYARRNEGRYTRTFDPTHFEFRGGNTEPRSPGSRTRSTD